MDAQSHAHEIYLLERYVSLDYFGQLRDTWATMVAHVEACLDVYMRNLHAHYRSRPLAEQPDVAWENRVLPNFRNTLQSLNQGFILLSHSDFKGLTSAHGPRGDFKGQMEYWSGWMSSDDQHLYEDYLNRCVEIAHNIVLTEGAYWESLSVSRYSDCLVPIEKPLRWPNYRINKDIAVESGKRPEKSGIYISDLVQDCCAQFLSTSHGLAPLARVLVGHEDLLHPITGEKYDEQPVFDERPCIWYLVERMDDGGTGMQYVGEHRSYRVPAGGKCPETGYYFTPARPGSRQVFQQGVVMPDVESSYGLAIWQWDGAEEERGI